MRVAFTKMHGAGNDYVYVDCLKGLPVPAASLPCLARAISDRHTGVGSDGLILIMPPKDDGTSLGFRMFNSDGSEGEMCGNGMRCFARYAVSRGLVSGIRFTVGTKAGPIACEVAPAGPEESWTVRCDLGRPALLAETVPTLLPAGPDGIAREVPLTVLGRELAVTAVSTGVPHAVIFVENIASFPWLEAGPVVESYPAFPRKTNVNFVQVLDRHRALVRVWERGAGPTRACGTGACAVVVAGVLTGRLERQARVALPGGELKVTWCGVDGHLKLEGPAAEICSGVFIYPSRGPKEES